MRITRKDVKRIARILDLCTPARKYIGSKTPAQAWNQCARPGWMAFLIRHVASQTCDAVSYCAAEGMIWDSHGFTVSPKSCDRIRRKFPWKRVEKMLLKLKE